MRVGYLVMGLGLAIVKWPLLLRASSLPLFENVVTCLPAALSLLSFRGLRYPVRLLPILLFESAWKLIWLSIVALPAVLAGDVDNATGKMIFACSLVVIHPGRRSVAVRVAAIRHSTGRSVALIALCRQTTLRTHAKWKNTTTAAKPDKCTTFHSSS